MITQEQLKTLIDYNPETGDVTWLKRDKSIIPNDKARKTWNTRFAGKLIDSIGNHGYLQIRILGHAYLLHRIIWLYVHGEFPEFIDHIDGNRTNNKLSNIRSATRTENNKNLGRNKKNKTGITGVFFHKQHKSYITYIGNKSERINLGSYDNLFDAACARKSAELKYNYHENHGRKV